MIPTMKFVPVLNSSTMNSGGTATYTTSALDTSGYDSIFFIIKFGAIAATGAATLSALLKGSDTDSAYTTITGGGYVYDATLPASCAVIGGSDDNKCLVLGYKKVQDPKKYLQVVFSSATAADIVIESVIAVLVGPQLEPPTTVASFFITN